MYLVKYLGEIMNYLGWPGKAELTLLGCFRLAGGKTVVLRVLGRRTHSLFAGVYSFPRSKLET